MPVPTILQLVRLLFVVLQIGDNPITTEGVMDFMNLLHKSDPENVLTKFEEIDFAVSLHRVSILQAVRYCCLDDEVSSAVKT